jgi:hypothetical protein
MMISAVKVAIVLEEYATEEHRSVMLFLCAKGLNAKGIHKEMFPVYDGKCLPRNAVHNWAKKSDKISLITKRLKRRCRSG